MRLLKDWSALLRLPNHATAAADVLAGWLLVKRLETVTMPDDTFWCVLAASLCFYAAGMILNDVFDVDLDRRERPERPLPTGSIAVPSASAVGHGLLVAGVLASAVASTRSQNWGTAVVGGILAIAVYVYDRFAKPTPAGPLVMGGCRSLNWLLGMTAAGGPTESADWLVPAGMGLYVAGITLFARDEAVKPRFMPLVVGTMLALAGLVGAGSFPWLTSSSTGWLAAGRLQNWTLLWSAIAGSVILRFVVGIANPSQESVRRAVVNAIVAIITLDAVLVLAACGESWAIVIIILIVPFLVGRRFASPT